jgi:transposase InsO family protein
MATDPDVPDDDPAIFAWINRYNTRRRHSTLGYITPVQWEHHYHQSKAQPTASSR